MQISVTADKDNKKWVTIGNNEPTHQSLGHLVKLVLGLSEGPSCRGYLFIQASYTPCQESRAITIKNQTFQFTPSLALDRMTLEDAATYLHTELTRLVEWYNRTFPLAYTFNIPDPKKG